MCPHAIFNMEATQVAPLTNLVSGGTATYPSPEVSATALEGIQRNVIVTFGTTSQYNPNQDRMFIPPSFPNFGNSLANTTSLLGSPTDSVQLESTGIPAWKTQKVSYDVSWSTVNKCLYVRLSMLGNVQSWNGCTSQSDSFIAVLHDFDGHWTAQERLYLDLHNATKLNLNQIRLELCDKYGTPFTEAHEVAAMIHVRCK